MKRKNWLDKHSRLLNKKKKIWTYNNNRITTFNPAIVRIKKNNPPFIKLELPQRFSLMDNPEETMKFFMCFAREIEQKEFGKYFYIDSSKVEYVTVDALIYLIAILQNKTFNRAMRYSFRGNYPLNEDARRVYKESGFNDYVKLNMKDLPRSTDKMRIVSGNRNKSETSRDVCDFVIKKLGKTKQQIQPLQKVLIELMSNVFYHAYENTFMTKKWYMYAEHVDNHVKCVFVDTGQGIAKTVRKNFRERLRTFVGIDNNDAKLIQSAFNGEFRTSTKEKHRGNGLLSVRANAGNDLFKRFEVLSGRGHCVLLKNVSENNMVITNYNNTLYGTLYMFVVE